MLMALEMFRIEGVKCNIPALKDVLVHPSFVDGTYHTDFLSGVAKTNGGNGAHHPGSDGKNDKELAAASGVAILLSMNGDAVLGGVGRQRGTGTWRLQGRREQMLSRTLESRGWR